MTTEILHKILSESRIFDLMFNISAPINNGMKISIQGKSIEDSIFLYERLNEYLYSNNIPFKVATAKRFDFFDVNEEQSHKAMTIYCADGFDFSQLCEDVYSLILDYKGWHAIKSPSNYQHYAGGFFFRNDRDANGNYIPAN